MVSSTSAARGAVVAKALALGTRRDRAAARNSCGRIIVATVDEGREGDMGRWGWERGAGLRRRSCSELESAGLHNESCDC